MRTGRLVSWLSLRWRWKETTICGKKIRATTSSSIDCPSSPAAKHHKNRVERQQTKGGKSKTRRNTRKGKKRTKNIAYARCVLRYGCVILLGSFWGSRPQLQHTPTLLKFIHRSKKRVERDREETVTSNAPILFLKVPVPKTKVPL